MATNPEVFRLLEGMLESGQAPEEACRDCPELLAEVRRRWEQFCVIDAEVGALLPGPGEAKPAPGPAVLPQVPGYWVESVLGRGGMGVVYKARHFRLNRTVALKMLLAGAYAGPRELARFQSEAETVAGLRHANIVQVYDVADHEGRPYFTMEFVEGGSLAGKLAGTPQPARQAAELVATLAEAVEVAHRGGVVHRDLKPANVLLTADGTPKISDFGLARRLEGGVAPTLSGLPLGTPSYMAPEQARGRAGAVGPAADVYGLGAILYELLTGRPPFRAETAVETLQQVVQHDPAPPSRLNPTVPRDLETICLKCLRKQPEERYASARELADDLGRFARGEPVAARPVGVGELVQKWARRSPAAAGLLVAVVLLVAGLGVGGWLFYQQRAAAVARQARADEDARAALGPARAQLEEGWLAHDLAMLRAAEAEGGRAGDIARNGGAGAAVLREVEEFGEEAAGKLGRAKKNRALLDALLDVSAPQETSAYVRDGAGRVRVLAQPSVDEQYAAAFRAWGLDVGRTAEAEVVGRLRQEPDVVVQEVIAGLDAWAAERQRQKRPGREWRRLFRLAERLDRGERQRRLRALLMGGAVPRAEWVAGLVGARSPWQTPWALGPGKAWPQLLEVRRGIDLRAEPVLAVVLLARALAAAGDGAGAEQVLVGALAARPAEVVLLDHLGKHLEQQGPSRLGEAIGYYQAARSQRRHLGIALSNALIRDGRREQAEGVLRELVRLQPDNPAMWLHLGVALHGRQRLAEAETFYRKAVALNPESAEAHYNLGIALMARRRPGDAEAAFRRTIGLKPDFAEAHANLGAALGAQGKPLEAEKACRRAIGLKHDLGEAYSNLGNALSHQRRYAEAVEACEKAAALKPDYAEARTNLGIALMGRGMYAEAEAALLKAIDLSPGLAEAHGRLGDALAAQGRGREAESAFRKAIDLQPDFAEARMKLGIALMGRQKYAEAGAAFQKTVDLSPGLSVAHYNLGNALAAQGRGREAESSFRKAIGIQPDFAEAHTNLGMALVGRGKYAEAEAAFREATKLKPGLVQAHYNLGVALRRQWKFDRAAASLKKAGELLPAGSPLREGARQLRRECERFAVLDARLPAVLRGDEKPATAGESVEFARLCYIKNRYAAAARLFRDAFNAEPMLARDVPAANRYNAACAAALAGCGRGKDADRLDDERRALWRRQALDWLRQDLAWCGAALDESDARTRANLRKWMRHWQAERGLAGVRGGEALARLQDEERKGWQKLWSDVDALLRRADGPE